MRAMMVQLWTLMGVLAGACVALQAPVNAELAKGLGLPVAAAAVSFAAGLVVLALVTLVMARTQGVSLAWGAPAPWLFVAGGVLGAFFVTSNIILTPRIGAAAVMALIITGQLLTGLLLDKAGFLGLAVREISFGRAAGVVLLIAGAVMIRYL